MSSLASYVSRVETPKYDDVCAEVLDQLNSEAGEWGLEIKDVYLTDMVECRTFRLISDTSVPEI